MNENLKELLISTKEKYKNESENKIKLDYLNVIIEIYLTSKIKNEYLYYYIKAWIELYINEKIKNMNYGYDTICMKKISTQINEVTEKDKRQSLYRYTKVLLNNHFHNAKDINECDKKIKDLEIEILTDSSNLIDLFKIVLLFTSKNLFTLSLSVLISIIIISIMLFPNSDDIIIKYVSYCDNLYLNHFINTTSYLFNLSNNGFEIYINSISSLIIVIIAKILFIIIVFNYIIIEILKKVFNYELI